MFKKKNFLLLTGIVLIILISLSLSFAQEMPADNKTSDFNKDLITHDNPLQDDDLKDTVNNPQIILNALKCLSIVDIDEEKIISSLENEEFTDFEDCLQDECAEEIRADYIVTRDMNDFTKSKIPAITPSDFVKLMK